MMKKQPWDTGKGKENLVKDNSIPYVDRYAELDGYESSFKNEHLF